MLLIVFLQVFELWFKQILHELRDVIAMFQAPYLKEQQATRCLHHLTRVVEILKGWFGWKHVHDLGDITTARGTEMYLPLWIRLWGNLQTHAFNIKVVR